MLLFYFTTEGYEIQISNYYCLDHIQMHAHHVEHAQVCRCAYHVLNRHGRWQWWAHTVLQYTHTVLKWACVHRIEQLCPHLVEQTQVAVVVVAALLMGVGRWIDIPASVETQAEWVSQSIGNAPASC